jgi:hypothetical protein
METNKNYTREVLKLASLLQARGFRFSVNDIWDGAQVILYDSRNRRIADAVCHSYSFGADEGTLEIMGLGAEDDVIGWLTAEDVLRIWTDCMEGRG